MPWAVAGAAVTAAGALGGAAMSGSAAQSAANQVAQSQANTLDFQKQVYGQTTGNLQPYVSTGQDALSALAGFYGLPGGNSGGAQQAFNQYTQTQPYQFNLRQGELAATRGLAASGLTGFGAQAKALTQYGQGVASQRFSGYLGQLASLAGMGQNAAVQTGNAGQAATGVVANANTMTGNALGSATVAGQNALNGAISQSLGALTSNNSLNALANMTGTSYAPGGNPGWDGQTQGGG